MAPEPASATEERLGSSRSAASAEMRSNTNANASTENRSSAESAEPAAQFGASRSAGYWLPMRSGSRTPVRLSISDRDPVVARLRTADQDAALMVDPDRLAAAQWHHRHIDIMTATPQILNDRLSYGALDPNLVAKGKNPRGIDSLLRIEAAIQNPVHKMRMSDCLVLAAHDAERHHRPPVFDEHRRDDRVKWSLPRRNHVRMPFDQAEAGAAVVQQHAALRRHDAGAEGGEQRIDERHCITVAVYCAEIDCVSLHSAAMPVWARHCPVEADLRPRLLGPRIG